MNSIEKLTFVLGAAPPPPPPQTDCVAIHNKYEKKIKSANSCETEGTREAGRITWIDNNHPEGGMTEFEWTWEDCAPEGETSFLPEGNVHKLTIESTGGPNQDGGSMRPRRGRGAMVTPGFIDPSMGSALDERRKKEKCEILIRHNEILYSLAIEKETALYNAGCGPYNPNVANRKDRFNRKKAEIKKGFQSKLINIKKRPPCK